MPRIRADSVGAHHDLVWAELVAALDELVEQRGYDDVSLADVAERVGMARTAIYNYARDKDVLLAGAVERVSRSAVAQVHEIVQRDEPAATRLEAIVTTLLRLLTSGTMRVALGRHLTGAGAGRLDTAEGLGPLDPLLGEVGSVIEDGIRRGELHPVSDVPLTVDLLGAMVLAGARRAIQAEERREALATTVSDLLIRALR